jgi:hypothetical protein
MCIIMYSYSFLCFEWSLTTKIEKIDPFSTVQGFKKITADLVEFSTDDLKQRLIKVFYDGKHICDDVNLSYTIHW